MVHFDFLPYVRTDCYCKYMIADGGTVATSMKMQIFDGSFDIMSRGFCGAWNNMNTKLARL